MISVENEIREFLKINWNDFTGIAKEVNREYHADGLAEYAGEHEGIDITIACNAAGTIWGFQTGDNSFTGGCYGLDHWAIGTIINGIGDNPFSFADHIIDQLDELVEL